MHQAISANPGEIPGISAKTNDIHHGKLYAAYVNKRNEIEEKLKAADVASANQIYSEWRGLKEGETFAANGMILHQQLFALLDASTSVEGTALHEALVAEWGSWERFEAEFIATGMAARGWAVLALDLFDGRLHLYAGDAQNHGGVWGTFPLVACDVYEHAYFLDHGADRKAYIQAFLGDVNWQKASELYENWKAKIA